MMCFEALLRGGPHMYLLGGSFPAQRQAGNTYTFAFFYFCKNKTRYPLSKDEYHDLVQFKLASYPFNVKDRTLRKGGKRKR